MLWLKGFIRLSLWSQFYDEPANHIFLIEIQRAGSQQYESISFSIEVAISFYRSNSNLLLEYSSVMILSNNFIGRKVHQRSLIGLCKIPFLVELSSRGLIL